MNRPEARDLAAKYFSGEMTETEAAELATLLRDNPGLESGFVSLVATERLLPLAMRPTSGDIFAMEALERIRLEQDQQGSSRFTGKTIVRISKADRFGKRALRIAIPLAAAAVIVIGLWFALPRPSVQLLHGTSARWEGTPPAGKIMPGTRLLLAEGIAKLEFDGGASVILEGPADFEISAGNHGRLRSGRASAIVSGNSQPLHLDGSFGTVSPPGSFFGISADASGSGEIQNFSGDIVASLPDGKKSFPVGKNETLRFINGMVRKVTGTRRDTFVTSVPPPPADNPRAISWTFNGDPSVSSGTLAPETTSALLALTQAGTKPAPVPGPFSPALSFDGIGSAIETDFRGLGGGAARTVTFWIRLPVDFSVEQGYGIISWGDLTEPGTAWQISANPRTEDGPLAGLRVSVGDSPVVGETRLNDGRWHHCAIVLYGGDTPSENTPVFLYIDGRPETSERKLVQAVRTNTSPAARPVWIGRSLGHDSPERPIPFGTGFFRGDLDEIHIFDSALSLHEITSLMQNKTPKND